MFYAIRLKSTGKFFSVSSGAFIVDFANVSDTLKFGARNMADDNAMMIAQAWPGEAIQVLKYAGPDTDDSSDQVKTTILWRN